MNILITGAKGQLGSELIKILETGHSELGSIPNEFFAAKVIGLDVDRLDITDSTAVSKLMKENRVDLVINCAAYTNVDGCEENLDTAFNVNAIGARNIAIVAEQMGAKLVQLSTDYVFSGNSTVPYAEWECCNPQSIYGKSKALGELYVRDFCSKYFIIRTAWLYGYVGRNFVKTILRLAREKGYLKVVDDQRGSPTNAVDLAHHILKIAATEEYGIYHCTGRGNCTWYEFACKIVEYARISCKVFPCNTKELGQAAKRPSYSSLDNIMLRNTVGDEFRNWEIALQYFMTHFKGE